MVIRKNVIYLGFEGLLKLNVETDRVPLQKGKKDKYKLKANKKKEKKTFWFAFNLYQFVKRKKMLHLQSICKTNTN